MLKHRDGRIANVETEYNNIFITKRGSVLSLSTRFRAESYVESLIDLKDPDDMPLEYTRLMPVGLVYPETTRHYPG